MAKLTQAERIFEILNQKPGKRFTAREITDRLLTKYSADYKEKRKNPRFESDDDFANQIVSEIGAQKNLIKKKFPVVQWQDNPRPRVYWCELQSEKLKSKDAESPSALEKDEDDTLNDTQVKEAALYPKLIEYLNSELGLLCLRINEKRSSNSRGPGGNQWLHPDIVALEPRDREWSPIVRECASAGSKQSVRLWSFEVKRRLNMGNIRKSFFQAVSNSSWSNEGYLVTAEIDQKDVEHELRMLSALHGIGVIVLNIDNPSESEMFIPARSREEVDWESVNRIVAENKDFSDYIEQVSNYFNTRRIRENDWNKTQE
jgi:uncharacterized protein